MFRDTVNQRLLSHFFLILSSFIFHSTPVSPLSPFQSPFPLIHFSPLHKKLKKSPTTYLISVFTLTQSTSYNFFKASLICLLLALTSQIKTRVLFSSIFFIALSVLRGWIITLWWSSRASWGTDLRGYLGVRESWRVLGRWNVVLRRTFRVLWACAYW